MEKPLTLVLADRHTLFLDALTSVLTRRGHRVLATASTRRALLDAIGVHDPDLCLIEAEFADGDGIEAIAGIRLARPGTRVVVLTADARTDTGARAFAAGASGFVHKSRGLAAVLESLQRVAAGDRVTAHGAAHGRDVHGHASRPADYLTPCELGCLRLLAAGRDTADMARDLGVSTATVRSHVQAVLSKLGAHSRLEAVALAIRHDLLDPTTQTELSG